MIGHKNHIGKGPLIPLGVALDAWLLRRGGVREGEGGLLMVVWGRSIGSVRIPRDISSSLSSVSFCSVSCSLEESGVCREQLVGIGVFWTLLGWISASVVIITMVGMGGGSSSFRRREEE